MTKPDVDIAPPADEVGPREADDVASGRLSITDAAMSGARSFARSRVVIEVILFSSTLAIARLVDPAAQGRAAVAMVFPIVASIFTFEGFGSALVSSKLPTRADSRTAMTMSLVAGFAFGGLIVLGAVTIGPSVVGRDTAHLIVLSSPSFAITATTCVSRAQMMRDLSFDRMSRNDVMTTVAGTASTVGFAIAGFEARALIYGIVVSSIVDMGLQFRYAPPVLPGWSRESAGRIFAFGSWASLSGLILTLQGNIDYLILGVTLPARLVGIYYRSFAFGVLYQGKITYVLTRMMFPLMARARDPKELRRVRERAVEFNAMVALPFLGLIVALAPLMVPILYGDQWRGAIEPTQILAVAGMATALNSGSTGPALALGQTRRLALVTFVTLVIYGIAILSATPYGLIVVCIAAATAHTVMMLVCQRYLIDKVIGLPAKQIAIDTGPAMVATIGAGLAAAASAQVLTFLPALLNITVSGLIGLVVYGIVMRLLFPRRAERLLAVIQRILRPRRPVAASS